MHKQLLLLLLIFPLLINAQSKDPKTSQPSLSIKQYFFVMLTAGPNRNQDSVTADKIQKGHMANIERLYTAGKLKVAGPFGDDGKWIGLFIFDCPEQAEVEKLLQTDPAIQSGRLVYEIHPWWTSPIGSFTPGAPKKVQE
jgi:uncharacterized protein